MKTIWDRIWDSRMDMQKGCNWTVVAACAYALMACTSRPPVLPITETVYERVLVPETLLEPCYFWVNPRGDENWEDLATLLQEANVRGKACNDQPQKIRDWMNELTP